MPLRQVEQRSFEGGINAVTDPFVVTDKQIFRGRNLLLDEHGALTTRPGYSVLSTSGDTTNPVVYLGVLNAANGATYPFHVQFDGSTNVIYRTDTGAAVGATTSSFPVPQSVTVLNQELFAVGYETPWVWDGTTFSRVTASGGGTLPVGARHAVFHLNAVWLFNTAQTSSTIEGPSSLRESAVNSVTSWPTANQTHLGRDDGQQGMGLSVYTIAETGISPTTTLVAFKNLSAYQVTGEYNGSTAAVQRIKTDMGCIAPRTIQFVSGFGVIRLSHKGFALFNGVDDKLISEEIRPYIFGKDDITGLSFTNVDRSWAVQVSSPPLYVAACPTVSTVLDRVFVYDLVRRAWSVCDFPVGLNALKLFTDQTAVLPVVRGGTSTKGQIVRLFNGLDTSDAGAAAAWSFRTRNFGSATRPTYWRRVTVDMAYTPTQTVTVSTSLGGIRSTTSRTLSFAGTKGSVYGKAVYGTDAYGTGMQDYAEAQDLLTTATWANSTISGSGNVRIRGLAYDVAPKPVRRLTTAGPL